MRRRIKGRRCNVNFFQGATTRRLPLSAKRFFQRRPCKVVQPPRPACRELCPPRAAVSHHAFQPWVRPAPRAPPPREWLCLRRSSPVFVRGLCAAEAASKAAGLKAERRPRFINARRNIAPHRPVAMATRSSVRESVRQAAGWQGGGAHRVHDSPPTRPSRALPRAPRPTPCTLGAWAARRARRRGGGGNEGRDGVNQGVNFVVETCILAA